MVLDPAWGTGDTGAGAWEKREGLVGGRCGRFWAEGEHREGPEARAPSRGWSSGSQCALEAWLWAMSCPWPSCSRASPSQAGREEGFHWLHLRGQHRG